MDLQNVSELIKGMKDYYASHDIRNADLIMYDELALTADPDPRIREMVQKDRHGEYIGISARNLIESASGSGLAGMSRITFFMRPDGRLAGAWNSMGRFGDNYELFDYHEGYYTGAMFGLIGRMEMHNSFAYYVTGEDGRVVEIIGIYGGMIAAGSDTVNISRTRLSYDGDETVLLSCINTRYKKTDDGYEPVAEEDLTVSGDQERSDRVIDDQKELFGKLRSSINEDMDLETIVKTFVNVISEAPANPEAEIEYAAGTNPFLFPGMDRGYLFCLMRQTPCEDDEFYQLILNVRFDIAGKIPYDHRYFNEDDDLIGYILASDPYNELKDKRITGIDIEVQET